MKMQNNTKMKKNILNTLLASVMLAATAGLMVACNANDDNAVAEPKTDFAPAGAEAVDLGLPSGTKWANMNIGAEKPEDYGLYFAWGETVGYTSDTSDGRMFDWSGYKWCGGSKTTLTKYCTKDSNGMVDDKTILGLEDDAAHVNWAGSWRMPTREEIKELLNNANLEWTTVSDVYGCKFTSIANGNSIFLPAAGYRDGLSLEEQSMSGLYWSSWLYGSSPAYAGCLNFQPQFQSMGNSPRSDGYPIRPVQ